MSPETDSKRLRSVSTQFFLPMRPKEMPPCCLYSERSRGDEHSARQSGESEWGEDAGLPRIFVSLFFLLLSFYALYNGNSTPRSLDGSVFFLGLPHSHSCLFTIFCII